MVGGIFENGLRELKKVAEPKLWLVLRQKVFSPEIRGMAGETLVFVPPGAVLRTRSALHGAIPGEKIYLEEH